MDRKQNWYWQNGSSGQGLIIEESTGRSVAVSYEADDAPLLSAAPCMRDELLAVKEWMEDCLFDRQERGLPSRQRYEAVCAAIVKARE